MNDCLLTPTGRDKMFCTIETKPGCMIDLMCPLDFSAKRIAVPHPRGERAADETESSPQAVAVLVTLHEST